MLQSDIYENMQIASQFTTAKGFPLPLGTSAQRQGINFALFAPTASKVKLLLYAYNAKKHTAEFLEKIPLSATEHKTGDIWHILIALPLQNSVIYAYEISQLDKNQNLVTYFPILDPYAKELFSSHTWGTTHCLSNSYTAAYQPLCVFNPPDSFDWGEERPPQIPTQDLIIYEMHVRGFTAHPSSKVSYPGTFQGLIEKIPYLLDLGINAVELMPVHEFNELEYARTYLPTKHVLYNFWGYSPVNFFALMNRYATDNSPGTVVKEFKTMVKEFHSHGIEVFLDVVFNHTSEGNENGPEVCYRPLADAVYYLKNHEHYFNYSGCGNTINSNHPIVQDLICDCLRYFVSELHVDGFRFDLAAILTRGTDGQPLSDPPVVERISNDPILSKVKLIAEPWDAAGLYQGGHMPGGNGRWSDWNGRYRDCVRQFIRGVPGTKGEFATRICGSEDIYHAVSPINSINFITAHDGFSLSDLVSYNRKHNLENAENNHDGFDYNESWNCGVEGVTYKQQIVALRQRQMRNFHLALMVSQGVPMLLMGDEYCHTKIGNNNTWCQDNELSWFLWDQRDIHKEFFRFYRLLNLFRKQHPSLRKTEFLTNQDIDWHGQQPFTPAWEKDNNLIAFVLKDKKEKDLYIAFNASSHELMLTLPHPPLHKLWHGIVNTYASSPYDFVEENNAMPLQSKNVTLMPYSAILLKAC